MPHFPIRATLFRTFVLGAAGALALGTVGATGAAAITSRPVAEPSNGLVVTLDGGATRIAAGAPVTYRATVTNRGHEDLTDLKVTINVSGPFVITEAKGGKVTRSAVAQWPATVPAGRAVVFALRGTFRAIPIMTRAITATGCVFVIGRAGPLVCDSALAGIVRASGATGVSTVATVVWAVGSACLSLVVVAIVVLAVFRRGRRAAAGTDSRDNGPDLSAVRTFPGRSS
jgi:hypothetical protein